MIKRITKYVISKAEGRLQKNNLHQIVSASVAIARGDFMGMFSHGPAAEEEIADVLLHYFAQPLPEEEQKDV